MDSSKIFGVAEECHSSESGWTMYIGSPIDGTDSDDHHGDDDHNTDDGVDHHKYCNKYYVNHNNDSDNDSMASDASSGPSRRQEYSWVNIEEGGHNMASYKNQEEKKAKNPVVEKNRNGKRKGKKEESLFAAKGADIPIQSTGDKVKKSNWFGKRK